VHTQIQVSSDVCRNIENGGYTRKRITYSLINDVFTHFFFLKYFALKFFTSIIGITMGCSPWIGPDSSSLHVRCRLALVDAHILHVSPLFHRLHLIIHIAWHNNKNVKSRTQRSQPSSEYLWSYNIAMTSSASKVVGHLTFHVLAWGVCYIKLAQCFCWQLLVIWTWCSLDSCGGRAFVTND
jgi:hypothetical protein